MSTESTPAAAPGRSAQRAPLVTFILCTRNRLASLRACVSSLQAACRYHAGLRSDIVIVDNGSADGTAQYLADTAANSDVAISLVSEPRRGLSIARNAGLRRARGEVLVFVDDDCVVDVAFLRDLERHYTKGDRQVIRGGRVELGNPDDLPFTIKCADECARLSRHVHPGGFVLGCNMTMHREVAARVGPFDERFGVGGPLQSAEDTDYVIRAHLLGIPVEYVPDMKVFHHHGRNTRQAVEAQHRAYCFGNGGIFLKHLLRAPWLLLHFWWTLRAACRQSLGGPRFDPELRLSHWPIVLMNLRGAAKLAGLMMFSRQGRTALREPRKAPARVG